MKPYSGGLPREDDPTITEIALLRNGRVKDTLAGVKRDRNYPAKYRKFDALMIFAATATVPASLSGNPMPFAYSGNT